MFGALTWFGEATLNIKMEYSIMLYFILLYSAHLRHGTGAFMKQEGIAVSAVIIGILTCVALNVADHAWLGYLTLALAAWGIFTLIQAGKKAGKVYRDSSFTAQEESDGQTRFDVRPAHRRSFTTLAALFIGLLIAAVVGVVTGSMVALYGSPLLLLSPIAGIGFALAVLHRNADRRESAFDTRIYVSEVVISYPDPAKDFALTMVPVDIIDRLRIQQSIANTNLVQFASTSPGVVVQNWGERSRAKWLNWFADHSYTLEAHAQGKRHVLAGGMDEITADGLMQAVSRKIHL